MKINSVKFTAKKGLTKVTILCEYQESEDDIDILSTSELVETDISPHVIRFEGKNIDEFECKIMALKKMYEFITEKIEKAWQD